VIALIAAAKKENEKMTKPTIDTITPNTRVVLSPEAEISRPTIIITHDSTHNTIREIV